MFASGANLILAPPSEFTFIVYVTPTGSLYGAAGTKAPAVDAFVIEKFDRAAPRGNGSAKLAGNYAPTFKHSAAAKKAGFPITLHLDSATRTYVDEFSTSNFLAIKKQADASAPKTLVVPESESILKSVTTKAIIQIAEDFGWAVERRRVHFQEVKDGQFEEVAACGTAAAVCISALRISLDHWADLLDFRSSPPFAPSPTTTRPRPQRRSPSATATTPDLGSSPSSASSLVSKAECRRTSTTGCGPRLELMGRLRRLARWIMGIQTNKPANEALIAFELQR